MRARSAKPAWLRAFERGAPADIAALCAPELQLHAHDPFVSTLPPGLAGLQAWLETLRTAFPDQRWTLTAESGQGRTHVYDFTVRGHHRGPLEGLRATGREVSFVGRMMIRHDAAGRVAELWLRTHLAALAAQLGMAPTPPATPPPPTPPRRAPRRAARTRSDRAQR